jgi:arylsulfatase A-like enzyme
LITAAAVAAEKPNLIVIMTDDMGYADVGFNGCEDIPTPNIDSIATNGVRFTSGYVAYPVCGPSRAAFMTGRYGQRFGFERNPQYRPNDPNMGLPLSETTMADALKKVGYHSGVIGKWHLGATKAHHPLSRGFNEFYGHLGGGHQYLPELLVLKDSYAAKDEAESYRTWIMRNHEHVPPSKYLTDAFSDEAVSFVERNHNKPFFLFLAYNAPHGPLQATEKYLSRFPQINDKKRRTYAAMVSAVDDGVGRVLAALKQKNVHDNTIIFFLSDNGGPTTKNGSRNTPLRGNKGDAWEGGFRVPFAAQWPKGFTKGRVYDHPVISLDIFATIAACAGAPETPGKPLDGVDLRPFVNGDNTDPPHKGIFLRKFDSKSRTVRSGDYKLVMFDDGKYQSLYNLSDDLSEESNVAVQKPEVQTSLLALWDEWNAENIDPIFLGLIHTNRRQAKTAKTKQQKNAPTGQKKDADYWKAQFFKKNPKADTDGDGVLSWPEFKAAKAKEKK